MGFAHVTKADVHASFPLIKPVVDITVHLLFILVYPRTLVSYKLSITFLVWLWKKHAIFASWVGFFSIFCLQTACQQDDDDDIDESDQQAEFDAMLIEYAGDILPSLATAVGGQIFAPYFAGFLPLLLKKTVSKLCYGGI